MDAYNLENLPEYASNFMILLTIDLCLLCIKLQRGYDCIQQGFTRTLFGRYHSTSYVFYISGIFKLILVDFSFLSGQDIVISAPIFSLTFIYTLSIIFFLPLLSVFMGMIDKLYLNVMKSEKAEVIRR